MAHKSLLPDHHPNRDFFVIDVFDTLQFKDDIASMEHPVFSLSTKPNTRVMSYEHNGNTLEISPSGYGLATIHDKDILLYCGSKMMQEINQGRVPNQTINITAHDLLIACNRKTNNLAYQRLKAALDRLSGTRIKTNIRTGKAAPKISNFGLIDTYEIVEKSKTDSRMVGIKIKVSDWFYSAVIGGEMLSISREYFRIRKPLERRIYELARKHCGRQKGWNIGLDTLLKKTGSKSPKKEFRRLIKSVSTTNLLPDYSVWFDESNDMVKFTNNKEQMPQTGNKSIDVNLQPETYRKAKNAAPNYDVYSLESEWISFWIESGKPPFEKNADAAFIGFCKNRHNRQPNP